MPIKHAFQSLKSDGADATLVRPSNWNADHSLVGDSFFKATAVDTLFAGISIDSVNTPSFIFGLATNADYDPNLDSWTSGFDGVNNGCGGVLFFHGSPSSLWFIVNETTGGTAQTITGTNFKAACRMKVKSTGVYIGQDANSPAGISLVKRTTSSQTPGLINDGAFLSFAVTLSGVLPGDLVLVGADSTFHDGVFVTAKASTDTVTVTIHNESGSNRTYGSAIAFTIMVLRVVA